MVMGDLGQSILEFLSGDQSFLGLVVLFVCAGVEYLFPPFPGDSVTLFGAFLSAQLGWSVPLVFLAVTLGSCFGAAGDYWVGYRLGLRPDSQLSRRSRTARHKVEPLLRRFSRHGAVYVAINRFLPGIRALFFVAAGMSGLPFWRVMLWGAVSAICWNVLIISAGFAIGHNWERLLSLFQTYTLVAWILIGVFMLIVLIWWGVKRLKSLS